MLERGSKKKEMDWIDCFWKKEERKNVGFEKFKAGEGELAQRIAGALLL